MGGRVLRYAICLLVAALAMAGTGMAGGFIVGFRLLDLDGRNVKWGRGDGLATVVTYAIVDRHMRFPEARNCTGVVPVDQLLANSRIDRTKFEHEVKAAFSMWEEVADITFRQVDNSQSAGILIGAQADPVGHAFANVDYRAGTESVTNSIREIGRSLICLNPSKTWKVGFDGKLTVYDLRYTIAHEIGHAIGLDHPEPASQLMSFKYHERFRSLQAGDVEGAVRLYGKRTSSISTSSENSTFEQKLGSSNPSTQWK